MSFDLVFFGGTGDLTWRKLMPALLQAGIRQAIAQAGPVRVGPWRDGTGQLRLAFLAPIAQNSPQPAVVVLHLDPKPHLHSSLAQWPLPQRTAEAFLFRRDGDQVQFLSARRYVDPQNADQTAPLSTPALFTARVLRGDAQPDEVLDGEDYRGVAALGVVRAIAGTDWWLLAKQDRVELMGDAVVRSFWLMLVALLGLMSAATLVYLLTQRGHLQAMAQHVNALRHAQTELRDSEARYRLLAENSSDVVWLFDLQRLRFIYVSPSVHRLLGYTPEEMAGRGFGHLLSPTVSVQVQTRLTQRLQAFANGDQSAIDSTDEILQRHKNGQLVMVEMVTRLVTNSHGEAVQVQGVSRDISARKAAEAQILQLSQATEQSPAGVIITNLKGDIEYVNAAFERITGYTRNEVLGRNPRMLQSGQTPASTYEAMWQALRDGAHWDGEVINRRKDGSHYHASLNVSPLLDERQRVTGYVGVAAWRRWWPVCSREPRVRRQRFLRPCCLAPAAAWPRRCSPSTRSSRTGTSPSRTPSRPAPSPPLRILPPMARPGGSSPSNRRSSAGSWLKETSGSSRARFCPICLFAPATPSMKSASAPASIVVGSARRRPRDRHLPPQRPRITRLIPASRSRRRTSAPASRAHRSPQRRAAMPS